MLRNIRILREEKRISQQKLGEIIGISQQSVNKYENHNIEPDINTLKLLADYFDTSVDFIIGYTDIRHKIENVTRMDLNDNEAKHMGEYRKLSDKQKKSIDLIIENYTEK